ncbi:MAG: aromatic ring-hydroxylating dioxygenase subunit alpha [Pseudomonas sp.]
MKAEENARLTQVGPGTPGGRLLRQYWTPAALTEELEGPRPVKAVTLLGEELVLFRNARDEYGLVARHCPHRGADMCFGRLEQDGLRCLFHGWLFDKHGQCLEQPAEPLGSTLHQRMRTRAYPCIERNGIVFAYLGEGEPPEFPAFDCFAAPRQYTFAFKGMWACNWLQALEVGIDPAHASYLHRFFVDEDPADSYGRQFRAEAANSQMPLTRVLREYDRPNINVEDTDYGFRIVTTRDLGDDTTHYRITNLVFPLAIAIPMSADMMIIQWHVPIDDRRCYWYSIFTSFGAPVDQARMRAQRMQQHTLPDYQPLTGRANNWGYDPGEQSTTTYTGMGLDINVHDQWAVESMGEIQDRTEEHLGRSDVAIVRNRRILRAAMDALEAGQPLPYRLDAATAARQSGPIALDAMGSTGAGAACWRERDQARRQACPWSDAIAEDIGQVG